MPEIEELEWWNNNAEFGEELDDADVPDNIPPDPFPLPDLLHREEGVRGPAGNRQPLPPTDPTNLPPPVPHHLVTLAERIRMIGDETESNALKYGPLARMVETNPQAEQPDRLVNITRIITDAYPQTCWQQVGLFMYAGVRLMLRSTEKITWKHMITGTVAEQIQRPLEQRIVGMGALRGIGDYSRTTTGRAWLAFAAGVASAILVYKDHSDGPSARDVGGLIRGSLSTYLRLPY